MNVKHINTKDFVAYGTSYMASTPMKMNHSHGFSRATHYGNWCRYYKYDDCFDVTSIDEVAKNDEVVLIRRQRQGKLDRGVASFSEF